MGKSKAPRKKLNDQRSRRERRADPARWYQVTEMADRIVAPVTAGDVAKLVEFERKVDVSEQDLNIQGPIEDVIIVSLPPDMFGSTATQVLTAVRQVLAWTDELGVDRDKLLALMHDSSGQTLRCPHKFDLSALTRRAVHRGHARPIHPVARWQR